MLSHKNEENFSGNVQNPRNQQNEKKKVQVSTINCGFVPPPEPPSISTKTQNMFENQSSTLFVRNLTVL